MKEGCRKYWKRALALLLALLLGLEGLPLQTFAAPRWGSYIPLISSRDEDEEEDYTEDAELVDDRPVLSAGTQLFSLSAFRASGSNASMSNALFRNMLLATPYSAFRQATGGYAAWTGPVEDASLTASNNYVKLDPANAVLKTPADFAIGKYGERIFSVQFAFRPSEVSDLVRNNLAMELWIPSGFNLNGIPSLNGVSFSSARQADGSTVLVGIPTPTTASVSGQITVTQDANKLINELPISGGELPFRMRIINNYRSTDPSKPPTLYALNSGDHDKTAELKLTTVHGNPTITVTNLSDSQTFMPGEITGAQSANATFAGNMVGRNVKTSQDYRASAEDNAYYILGDANMGLKGPWRRKGFEITVHKDEGYLADGTRIHFVLPDEGVRFDQGGVLYWTYKTDDGIELPWTNIGDRNNFAIGGNIRDLTINGVSLYNQQVTANAYREAVPGSQLSYADIYRKPGTFHLRYYPMMYYNRLYEGNWANTTYTAASGSYLEQPDNTNFGAKAKTEGSPLKFTLVQGTTPIRLRNDILDHTLGADYIPTVLNSVPQYSTTSPEYADTEELKASFRFDDADDAFKIQDNLSVKYDYEEALAPYYLNNLGLDPKYGLSYRLYIKDAVTGQVEVRTLVPGNEYPTYTPQSISYAGQTVTESVIDGSGITDYTFADADAAGNRKYISRIEVFKKKYDYNHKGSYSLWQWGVGNDKNWFTYKLRAYHHRLSDGTDIPDNYEAKIQRSVTSDQIAAENGEAQFAKEFKIRTRHLSDNLRAVIDGLNPMEVNKHPEINAFGLFGVVKYPDTMDYNVDANGAPIAFGQPNYDPVVMEIAGDAVTLAEYLEKSDLRLLGVTDQNGTYHDLAAEGINSEDPAYLKDGISRYSNTRETVFTNANDNGPFEGKVYDLKAIANQLGTGYFTGMVVALENINSVKSNTVGGNKQNYRFFTQKVYPGHMNYDAVVGTAGAADLPKQLRYSNALYCRYSDYKSEVVDHNPPQDTTIHGISQYHGTARKANGNSAKLILGDSAKGISVLDLDYYVNPWSVIDESRLGQEFFPPGAATDLNRTLYKVNAIGQGLGRTTPNEVNYRELELTRIEVDNTGVTYTNSAQPEIYYQNASLDFSGTSPRLLSLVNAVSFGVQYSRTYQNFIIDATLSDGTTKHIEDTLMGQATSGFNGRLHYVIPGVDVKNGPYITALKISFPNELNWGVNNTKMAADGSVGGNGLLPTVGLSLVKQDIPKKYPGTTIPVGSLSEKDSDANYDKLTVKAKLYFENVYGDDMTTNANRFTVEGASERIAGQQVNVGFLQNSLNYQGITTYQGRELSVTGELPFALTPSTYNYAVSKDLKIRPTYYIKVDKSFTYVDGSMVVKAFQKDPAGTWVWGQSSASVNFVPAGTGAGESGHADYGVLVVSMDQTPDSELAILGRNLGYSNGLLWMGTSYQLNFRLQAGYSADPVNVKPLPGVWLDTKFDANRDGNGGNADDVTVETNNENRQLVQDGPRGTQFGNATAAKAGASANEAEMLYAANDTTHKINQVTALGLLAFAQATKPFAESATVVESRDLNNNPNIFSAKVFLTSDDVNPTNDWEIYIPVPKKGEQFSYQSGGTTQTTPAAQFAMDYYGVDVSALTGLNYTISYTTDPNPAANGYTGAKAATWTTTKPADADITMVKVNVSNMPAGRKASVTLRYQLHERKNKILNMDDYIVTYGNFRMGTNPTPFYGASGQSSNTLHYILRDLTLNGYVFQDTNFNSVYDAGTDSYLSGIQMRLREADGVTEVLRNDNNQVFANGTNGSGYYYLYVPHEGNWTVWADRSGVSPARKLVKKDQGSDPTLSSRFDRNTDLATVTVMADIPARQFNLPNVNAGYYNVPQLDLADQVLHVGDAATTVTPTLTNPVDPTNPVVNYAIQTGAPTDLVTATGSGTVSGTLTPQKTGITTVRLTTDDGYGELITKDVKVTVWADVKYDSNGADSGSISANGEQLYPSTTAAGADAHSDETTAKSSAGTAGVDTQLVRAGYYFDGWNTKPDGTGTAYAAGAAIKTGKIDSDLKLYAVWRPVTPATDSFSIEKLLKGDYGLLPDGQRAPLTAENFSFTLTGTSFTAAHVTAEPMPTGSAKESSRDETPGQNPVVNYTLSSNDLSLITPGSPDVTVNATAGATFTSGNLTFTMPGTYVYTLKENAGSAQYYGYDAKVYTITYVVTQTGAGLGNGLTVVRTISHIDPTSGAAVTDTQASFENTYTLPRYTVTFDPDQGSFTPPTQTHRYGDRVTEPAVQNNAAGVVTSPAGERYGYHFKHWKAPDGTQFQFVGSSVRANLTLTAVWEINTYPVKVLDSASADAPHANEVIFDNGGARMAHGTVLTAPTAPENKTGYHFDHWENDADHSTFTFGNPVTGPLTIRAVYAPNAYTVKYDKNATSASGSTADSTHVYDQTRALTANGYTNPGYYFAGWSRTASGTTVDLNDGDNVLNLTAQNNGTVTLYAIWQPVNPVSDSFDVSKLLFGDFGALQGGETAPLVPDTFRFVLQSVTTPTGTTTVLPAVPGGGAASGITVTPGAGTMGYTLPSAQLQVPAAGSAAATAGAAAVANFPAGLFTFSYPGTYVYTLKETAGSAQYYSYDPAVYTITFTVTQSAGALGAGTGNSLTVTRSITKQSGGASAAATELQFENRYTLPRFTVQYDAEGGSHTPANESVRYGDYATVPPVVNNAAGTPTSPAGEKTGYHFLYWTDAAGTQFPFGSTPIHSNVTLHAKWEINRYTVTVQDAPDADAGHQNNQLAQHSNVPHGDTSLTAPVQPENKTGYHFDHWEDQNNTPYTFGSPVTGDTTVHAVYTPNTYTVVYEPNAGGTTVNGNMPNLNMTYDTPQNLTPNGFDRPGYQFMGWGTSPTATTPAYYDGVSVNNLTPTNGGTVHLYAIWTAVTPFDHDPALTKILGGEAHRTLLTGETTPLTPETFRFELRAVSTTAPGMTTLPMPVNAHGAQTYTVTHTGDGTEQLGSIRFLFAGDYVYELRELAGTALAGSPAAAQGSYTYDNAVYRITYHITQTGTVMNGSVTVEKQTVGGAYSAPVAYTTATTPAFTNDYLLPRYTVSFNANGGSVTPTSQTIVYGDPLVAPPTVGDSPAGSRTGYTFTNWQNPDGSPVNFATPVTGNLILTAGWTLRHYTVTVQDAPDADPGHQNQIITQDTNAVHGSTPTEPARPDNKTNFIFDHWAKPDGSAYNFDEPLTGELTIHAVYRQKRYTVRYDSGTPHSVGSMTDSHFGGGDTNPLSPNQYARPGYTFGGWSNTPGSTTTDFTDGQPVTNLTTSDGATVTLYAVWVPATPAVLHDPPVQKIITGGTPHNAGTFTFLLRAVSTTAPEAAGVLPMPLAAGSNQEMQLEIQGAGTGEFGDISFRLPGTYVYEIRELPLGRKGFTFDTEPVTVTYVVTQQGNVLTASRSMEKAGQTVTAATFTNEFEKPYYTITFDSNGSWIRIPEQSVKEGEHGKDPNQRMLRTESKFIGWYLNGQPYDFNAPVYDDITLVAEYEYKYSPDNGGGGGGGRGGNSSGHRGGATPNSDPLNPGISDNTVVPPVSPTELTPDHPAEEQRTPHGEAISPTERHKTTVITGTSKRSKRGKLPKTGEAPILNSFPKFITLALAAYALFTAEKRRRERMV